MSRTVPFDKAEKCDACGVVGAFDFMGDFLCADCFKKHNPPEQAMRPEVSRRLDLIRANSEIIQQCLIAHGLADFVAPGVYRYDGLDARAKAAEHVERCVVCLAAQQEIHNDFAALKEQP